MSLLLDTLRFINILAAAVVAGGQIYVFRVVMPVKKRFDTQTAVAVHNAMLGHQTDHYMKPAGLISGLSALAIVLLAAFGAAAVPPVSIALTVLGILGTVGVALLSRYFNVPTNAMMLHWSLDNIPADYPAIRQRWDLIHTFRVTCGVTALVFYLLAALIARSG